MPETRKETRCASCQGIWPVSEDVETIICPLCQSKYPPALLKATRDKFDYALGLRDRRVLRFAKASIHGEWVTLYGHTEPDETPIEKAMLGLSFPRGINVRLSEIIWAASAPEGS